LYEDLQNNGVRCWFAPEDMKIAAPIRNSINDAIDSQEKLLLILSKSSVRSQWVEFEVEKAFEKERKKESYVLFPIRIDDEVFESNTGWANHLKNVRNIGDFKNWDDDKKYQRSFKRLLEALKSEYIKE
jgi:hypothetical protein